MIENRNPNSFYSFDQMIERQKYITTLKSDLLEKLKDLTNKIETEEPFPTEIWILIVYAQYMMELMKY